MSDYFKALSYSLLLHALIILTLIGLPQAEHKRYRITQSKKPNKEKIIQSVAINSSEIDNEIKRIQAQREEKRLAEIFRKQQLKRQAQSIKQKRELEQRKLARLERRAKALAKRNRELLIKERKKLSLLKQKQLQEAKRVKKEQARLARLKLREEKLKEAEDKRKQQIRAEKLKRQRAILAEKKRREALASAQKAAKLQGEVNKYKALIVNAISQHWIVPPEADKSLACRFEIQLASNGQVLNVRLLKSSGDAVLDRSARTAIYKGSPLPVPKTPEAFAQFKVISLTVKPESIFN